MGHFHPRLIYLQDWLEPTRAEPLIVESKKRHNKLECLILTSLIFVNMDWANPSGPFFNRLPALPQSIRLGCRGLLGTNALAYCCIRQQNVLQDRSETTSPTFDRVALFVRDKRFLSLIVVSSTLPPPPTTTTRTTIDGDESIFQKLIDNFWWQVLASESWSQF